MGKRHGHAGRVAHTNGLPELNFLDYGSLSAELAQFLLQMKARLQLDKSKASSAPAQGATMHGPFVRKDAILAFNPAFPLLASHLHLVGLLRH